MTTHLIAFADGLRMGTITQARNGQLAFPIPRNGSIPHPLSISMLLGPEQYGHRKIEPFLRPASGATMCMLRSPRDLAGTQTVRTEVGRSARR
jgi:hypothetical protein